MIPLFLDYSVFLIIIIISPISRMCRARHHFKNCTCAFNPHYSSTWCRDYCYSHRADEEIEAQLKQFPKSQSELND